MNRKQWCRDIRIIKRRESRTGVVVDRWSIIDNNKK